jgi:MerR family copper efflux transcriptional regulator
MTNGETMRIGQLSRLSGKTARTLHFYEELGLLTPAARTRGGFRLYSRGALVRIQWIERLQELGFSLQEVSEFLRDLHAHDTGRDTMAHLRDFYERKVVETRSAIARLQKLESELGDAIKYLDSCRGCESDTASVHCVNCHETNDKTLPDMVAAIHDAV